MDAGEGGAEWGMQEAVSRLSRNDAVGIHVGREISYASEVHRGISGHAPPPPKGEEALLQCRRILRCKHLSFSLLHVRIRPFLPYNCIVTA